VNDVDVILENPWMKLVGTINVNLKKKFLKLWFKKKNYIARHFSYLERRAYGSTRGSFEQEFFFFCT
jgi:hypothetical protein